MLNIAASLGFLWRGGSGCIGAVRDGGVIYADAGYGVELLEDSIGERQDGGVVIISSAGIVFVERSMGGDEDNRSRCLVD